MSQGLHMRSFLRRASGRQKHQESALGQAIVPQNTSGSQSIDSALAPALHGTMTSATGASDPQGLLVLTSPEDAEVDIVFVHGLRGHRIDTWTRKAPGEIDCFWPKDLLSKDIEKARYVHGDVNCLKVQYTDTGI
jgi:hypothetical protein